MIDDVGRDRGNEPATRLLSQLKIMFIFTQPQICGDSQTLTFRLIVLLYSQAT